MNVKKELGNKIKKIRQKEGLTQEQFAEKINIATRTLAGIEIGESFISAQASLNGWEIFGLGLSAYAVGKGVEKVSPYIWNSTVKAGNTIADAATRTGKAAAKVTKHAAKKVELEYAFAKDSLNTANKNANNILKLGKAGKVLTKAAPVVAAVVSTAEVVNAYNKGGTKAAVKQGAKSASGLACAAAGAKLGAVIGTFTGPAAPIAVPVLTVVGSIAGYVGGEKIMEEVISLFK